MLTPTVWTFYDFVYHIPHLFFYYITFYSSIQAFRDTTQIVTVLPSDTRELAIQKGKDYVTLVTCTPYGINSHRLLVRGERTEFDETEDISALSVEETGTFWSRLPVQYRHMLIGIGVIIVFLILWTSENLIVRTIKKRRES